MSHLGRPNGQRSPKHSLRPVYEELKQKLKTRVHFADDCVSEEALAQSREIRNGEVLLLENLRFHSEEERTYKDPETGQKQPVSQERVHLFCNKLSEMGDFFVNDAFGTSHRMHSSIVGTSHSIKASGILLEKEIKVSGQSLSDYI